MRFGLTGILSLLLAGCATAYQPQGLSGGFSETQLDKNVFRVTFNGNGYTDRNRAEEFALLRSAEVSLRNGCSHFVIVDGQSSAQSYSFTTPMQTNTYGSASVYGNTMYGNATTTTSGGQTYHVQKPRTTNTIVCLQSKPEGVFAYDAALVYQSLTQKYGIAATR